MALTERRNVKHKFSVNGPAGVLSALGLAGFQMA